jgi:hypothetical protein
MPEIPTPITSACVCLHVVVFTGTNIQRPVSPQVQLPAASKHHGRQSAERSTKRMQIFSCTMLGAVEHSRANMQQLAIACPVFTCAAPSTLTTHLLQHHLIRVHLRKITATASPFKCRSCFLETPLAALLVHNDASTRPCWCTMMPAPDLASCTLPCALLLVHVGCAASGTRGLKWHQLRGSFCCCCCCMHSLKQG